MGKSPHGVQKQHTNKWDPRVQVGIVHDFCLEKLPCGQLRVEQGGWLISHGWDKLKCMKHIWIIILEEMVHLQNPISTRGRQICLGLTFAHRLFTYPIKRKENERKYRSIQKSSVAAEKDIINEMIMSLVCNHNWNNGDVPDDLRWCRFNKAATVKENWRHEEICSTWQITPQQVLIFGERNTQKLISLPAVNETASCDSCCPAQKFN